MPLTERQPPDSSSQQASSWLPDETWQSLSSVGSLQVTKRTTALLHARFGLGE